MDESSNNAIRFASEDVSPPNATSNWYVVMFAVIITLFAVYWGFVRPTSRQLTKLRRYVTSLEKSIADLNGERATTEATAALLDQLVQQGTATAEANVALQEMQELHRKIVFESSQLRSAKHALEKLTELRRDVARQTSLITSTDAALDTINDLHQRLGQSAADTLEAEDALERLNVLRDGLVESIQRVDATSPIVTKVERLHNRLADAADTTEEARIVSENLLAIEEDLLNRGSYAETAQLALDDLIDLRDQLQAQSTGIAKANTALAQMARLQDSVASQTDTVVSAIETLELSADVQLEMQRVGKTFDGMKRMLTEMVILQPTLHQALKSLQPLEKLSDLRRLDTEQLRQVAELVTKRHHTISQQFAEVPSEVLADATETAVK